MTPPREWFDRPSLDAPTPLTITDDGQVFGHVALWATCHIGIPGACVTPPSSPSDYAFFHLGSRRTDQGDVAVGSLTLDTGHPSLNLGAKATVAHYDHTGTAVADVRVYEDRYGPVAAGAIRDDLDEATITKLRAAKPSGDWREIDGHLELVGLLAVNVPGFPVVAPRARVASGHGVALVAALAAPADPALRKRLRDNADFRAATDTLLWRAAVPALVARVR